MPTTFRRSWGMLPVLCISILVSVVGIPLGADETAPPIRALLVTGGGWHDFETQKNLITEGLSERIHVHWTIDHEAGRRADFAPTRFENTDWIEGFDIVIHNHGLTNLREHDPLAARIADAHAKSGVAAVVIHNTLHSLRDSKQWHEFMGVVSRRHESNRPREIRNLAPEHPIMRGFGETWKPATVELYTIEGLSPGVTLLADCYGEDTGRRHVTYWTHRYGKAPVFGTTIGHDNRAVADPVYLNTLARGVLWATGKLDADGNPLPAWNRSLGSAP
jgi:uncharacterized protein